MGQPGALRPAKASFFQSLRFFAGRERFRRTSRPPYWARAAVLGATPWPSYWARRRGRRQWRSEKCWTLTVAETLRLEAVVGGAPVRLNAPFMTADELGARWDDSTHHLSPSLHHFSPGTLPMFCRDTIVTLSLGLLGAAWGAVAVAGHCQRGCHRCPKCQEVCQAKVSKEDVKKTRYEVDCEKICIPRITLPWQGCKTNGCCSCGDKSCSGGCKQPAKCGRVRTVRRLVKKSYTCQKCKYTWEVDDVECSPCNGGPCVAQTVVPPRPQVTPKVNRPTQSHAAFRAASAPPVIVEPIPASLRGNGY